MAEEINPVTMDATPLAKTELRLAVEIPAKKLSPEAERALAEAEARRQLAAAIASLAPEAREINGPQGPEPTRYGDWERKGIISDF